MKYIVIQDAHGGEFAVFCLAPQTHAEMAAAWRRDESRRVVAAGFCELCSEYVAARTPQWRPYVSVFGRSESLNIGNRGTKDAALITAMYLGTLDMARHAEVQMSPEVARITT